MKNLSTGKGYGQKIRFLKSLTTKAESILKTDYAETWGGKIHVHSNDTGSLSTLSISGVFGPRDTQTVKDNVFSGNIVVDLGANIGYFTCLLAKLVGEDGKVFAFEPDPRNLKLLKRNIQENDYKNVIIIDKAASDVNGPCTLYSAQKKFGANRIFESKKTQTQDFIPIKSETICLDDYFKKQDLLKKIDFIKIDIEGSEFRAFNGMKKILELNNNLKIFTEIAPSLLEDAGSSEKQILDFLQEHEFINFFISDNRKDTLSKITKNQLLTQLEQLHSINILCTK